MTIGVIRLSCGRILDWAFPGLLQAMRLGNVAVVNTPGAGVLENSGLFSIYGGRLSLFSERRVDITFHCHMVVWTSA
jgi:hypothetical protein